MNEDTLLETITELAQEHLEWEGSLGRDMKLVEDLDLDSVRLFTLAVEIENHFQILLDETDEQALVTVGDLLDLVGKKLAS